MRRIALPELMVGLKRPPSPDAGAIPDPPLEAAEENSQTAFSHRPRVFPSVSLK